MRIFHTSRARTRGGSRLSRLLAIDEPVGLHVAADDGRGKDDLVHGAVLLCEKIPVTIHDGGPLVRRAAGSTVAGLFGARARLHPGGGARRWSAPVSPTASSTRARGASRGPSQHAGPDTGRASRCCPRTGSSTSRCSSRPRASAPSSRARTGASRAPELAHCLDLVEPACVIVSPRHADTLAGLGAYGAGAASCWARSTSASSPRAPPRRTSTRTWRSTPRTPSSSSTRAARRACPRAPCSATAPRSPATSSSAPSSASQADDTFVAWSPLYHMGAAEWSLGTLMSGGKVIVVDGFDRARLAELVASRAARVAAADARDGRWLRRGARGARDTRARRAGLRRHGRPRAARRDRARSRRCSARPYANTFGATETGCPPCSSSLIPVGVAPHAPVQAAEPLLRGPPRRRRRSRRARWLARASFACVARRSSAVTGATRRPTRTTSAAAGSTWATSSCATPDGSLDFVDRVKYLIKIGRRERLPRRDRARAPADPRVADAAVVRRRDRALGRGPGRLRRPPRRVGHRRRAARPLPRSSSRGTSSPRTSSSSRYDAFPRSASGKVQRHELEKRLARRTRRHEPPRPRARRRASRLPPPTTSSCAARASAAISSAS